MESLPPPLPDAAELTSRTAIVVWPAGDIDAKAFARLLPRGCRPGRILLVRLHVAYVPHVAPASQARTTDLGDGVQLVDLHFGFDDDPDIPLALSRIVDLEPSSTHYWIIDDRCGAERVEGLPRWRQLLFSAMSAASEPASRYFHLPLEHATEVWIDRHSEKTG